MVSVWLVQSNEDLVARTAAGSVAGSAAMASARPRRSPSPGRAMYSSEPRLTVPGTGAVAEGTYGRRTAVAGEG